MNEYVVEMSVIGSYKNVIFAESIEEAKKLAIKICRNRYNITFDKASYEVKSIESRDPVVKGEYL